MQNTAVECSAIADPAAHQDCIDRRAECASAAGAPARDTDRRHRFAHRSTQFDTIQPSTVLNSQAIEQRGFVNAADALNELPQFGIPGSSPVGAAQGGAFGTGQSFVNFLGLGSQRTLVLVNGRRFVSSNSASIFGPTAAGRAGRPRPHQHQTDRPDRDDRHRRRPDLRLGCDRRHD